MSWSTEFDDPIMLANGSVLFTLRDAANHVMALPKTESAQPHWQLAVECLMKAAEKRGPLMFARIAMIKALTHGQAVEPPAQRRKAPNRFGEGKAAMQTEPFSGVTVPLDVEAVAARCSRSHASNAVKSGMLCSLRTRSRSSAPCPLTPRSILNSASMRLTASRAIGEIAAAFLSRLALAAMSASSKNCRLACGPTKCGRNRSLRARGVI